MLTKNNSSSELTRRIQTRMQYANFIIQQQAVKDGCQGTITLEGGSGGTKNASVFTDVTEGQTYTTLAEQTEILENNACPAPAAAPAPVIVLRLLLLGDTTVDTVKTSLTTRFNTLGYTNTITITARQLSTTETGSDLTTSNYDVLLMYTNTGHIGADALATAITSFIDAGGHFVNTANFFGTLYPGGVSGTFGSTSTYSAFTPPVGFNSTIGTNMFVVVTSVITDGVGVALTNGVAVGGSGNPQVVAGGTKLATSGSGGNSLLAIGTKGSSRLVSINRYIGAIDTYTNLRDLVANAVLYAKSLI